MGSQDQPHLQHMQGYAGKALHSIQQKAQQLTQASQYDAELLHLAVPALAAMLLEPLMNVVSAGGWLKRRQLSGLGCRHGLSNTAHTQLHECLHECLDGLLRWVARHSLCLSGR